MKRICLISYFTTIFNILVQKIFFNFFFCEKWKHHALCVYQVSAKKLPVWTFFFLKLAIWQIFGRIQPNFLGKFWLFYVKTNDLQPVSCFVPVLAFVCLDFFEYKYSAAESHWVCRRANLVAPLAHFQISDFEIVNIQSKNSSKCNVSKSTFWVSSISSSSKKCRLYDSLRSLTFLFRTTDMYPSQRKTVKVKCYISKIPVNF